MSSLAPHSIFEWVVFYIIMEPQSHQLSNYGIFQSTMHIQSGYFVGTEIAQSTCTLLIWCDYYVGIKIKTYTERRMLYTQYTLRFCFDS